MTRHMLTCLAVSFILLLQAPATPVYAAKSPAPPWFTWTTVVNNISEIPEAFGRTFNSYNQPSVNAGGLVVFRARSRGGDGNGQATHGIYLRDMSSPVSEIIRVFDRSTEVPAPKNLTTTFSEPPSFPRIDIDSDTIVTRANHQPVYSLSDGTRVGTSGIYAYLDSSLVTGAARFGTVPDYSYFKVPGFDPNDPPIPFDVFPGAPSVTDGATIVFKGNYTVEDVMKTGVYYRDLDDPKGDVRLIADSFTPIPEGSGTTFGSTAPPSAADGMAVFAGFDNEDDPSLGGIYLVSLLSGGGQIVQDPGLHLEPLVTIGSRVPGGSARDTFTHLGEGLAFDGRYVGFWGAWGKATKNVRLFCPEEGDKERIDYCINQDPVTICKNGKCYQDKQVPMNQGIFIHDIQTGRTTIAAKVQSGFDDFLFWNYSGSVAATGGGHEEDEGGHDGEPVRWRSSAFVAVSGQGKTFYAVFKAKKGDVTGIYLCLGPGQTALTLLDTTTEGRKIDPMAPEGSIVTEVGLEREGLRKGRLVVNARMEVEGETHEDGMAGIYMTRVPLLQ